MVSKVFDICDKLLAFKVVGNDFFDQFHVTNSTKYDYKSLVSFLLENIAINIVTLLRTKTKLCLLIIKNNTKN